MTQVQTLFNERPKELDICLWGQSRAKDVCSNIKNYFISAQPAIRGVLVPGLVDPELGVGRLEGGDGVEGDLSVLRLPNLLQRVECARNL